MIETDTDPAICEAILLTLEDRDPTKSFATFSNPRTLRAAQAQDQIGWLHTTEGKISAQWKQLQAEHYRSINSRRSPRKWAAELITNLLSVKQGQGLLAAIQNQLALGLEGLHVRDHHYITRGSACILALPAANKQAWLSGILIAWETYLHNEAREMGDMRNFMLHWLAQG
jgi:hypothetical protein